MDTVMPRAEWDAVFRPVTVEFERLVKGSGAESVILLDTSANCLLSAGTEPNFDLTQFAVLAAGDYLATREIADLLGEESLRWVVHQGADRGLIIAPVQSMLLLTIIFDRKTTLGLVRHQIKREWKRLQLALGPLADLLATRMRGEDDETLTVAERRSLDQFGEDEERLRASIDQMFDGSGS